MTEPRLICLVLGTRLQLTSVHALETSFAALTAIKPTWTPERQYTWDVKSPPVASLAGAAANAEQVDSTETTGGVDGFGVDSASVLLDASVPGTLREPQSVALDESGSTADPIALDVKPGRGGDGDPPSRPDQQERPADAFNPLLFRALQSVAQRTEQEAIRDYERERQQEEQHQERERRDKREASSVAPVTA